ncbi:cysteine--tRNA ligase [Candidatus Saccharibacteria bacterium RIFCSPHIGHO2_02_FULL_47_12]|nr:MAG: cysteine--tRNA ligase [Candidatus Saccharibacteria bacterium RIFCSPHIGHO2_02_FULL_47_12]
MKLYNSLTKKLEEFKPQTGNSVGLYTCGPTVYDHVHIGNLRTYIFEDTLRRSLKQLGYKVKHVMNITDVDDKTIARSHQKYPSDDPKEALKKLTRHYEDVFIKDAEALGIDFSESKIVRATEHVNQMQELIRNIPNKYMAADGVYFDITKYPDYGVFVNLDQSHTHHRIENDEYDKDHVADFALWKKKKEDHEPSWVFELDGQQLDGRPGWHIECSAMATHYLGQPFDIHTGGVDLKFPHHENEIAQSKSANGKDLSNVFLHAEHLLVDGHKMSKSLNNFYTLDDIAKKGYDPMAFRLLVLQSHYRSQLNFSWESLEAAQNALNTIMQWADLKHQPNATVMDEGIDANRWIKENFLAPLADDLNTPTALSELFKLIARVQPGEKLSDQNYASILTEIDKQLGLDVSDRPDIDEEQKQLIKQREQARDQKDWGKADELRKQLEEQGVGINDTPAGPIWFRL